MMQSYRENTPTELGGAAVTTLKDYAGQVSTDMQSGSKTPIDLPKSDVLQFVTADGSVISARPSGTEPKIKFYCSVRGDLSDASQFEQVSAELDAKIDRIMHDLGVG